MTTDAELEKAMRWVIRGLKKAEVDPNNVQGVVTWMIENPMPDKEVWLEETEAQDETDRLAHIEALEAQLTELKGGITNV